MKRLLCCAATMLVILGLPFCVSRNIATTKPVPFQPQAFAGHSASNGRSCMCGDADCVCDPGEQPAALKINANQPKTSASNKGIPNQPVMPDTEPGLAMLIVALLFAVLLRMR